MEEQKIKRRINWWLEDVDFLSRSNFHDLYYLESLCKTISNMIKNLPIPVLTSYDSRNKAIYFTVGSIKKGFPLDTNIAYFDFITLVKRYLIQFFPSYEITYEKEIDLTEDEILIKVREEKVNLNDALLMKKKVKIKEKGIIEKITMMKDEFVLNRNGQKEVRISGSVYLPMSLSTFMDKLKIIKNDQKKFNFIEENSCFIKFIEDNKSEISITYSGQQLFNFFKINFEDLKSFSLEQIDNFNYKWGRFKIKFDSLTLKNDCLGFYNKEIK
jgi:hypothetical protein